MWCRLNCLVVWYRFLAQTDENDSCSMGVLGVTQMSIKEVSRSSYRHCRDDSTSTDIEHLGMCCTINRDKEAKYSEQRACVPLNQSEALLHESMLDQERLQDKTYL